MGTKNSLLISMQNKRILIGTIFFLLIGSFSGFSQDKQAELEQRRLQLQREIKQLQDLVASTRQKERSVLTEVEDLNTRIRTRENLIKVTNQQANELTRNINSNIQKIGQLRKELQLQKDEYAKLILKSQKSKSEQSRMMFLLSSEDFLQAYKRMQYMQQFANYRKKQAEEIEQKTIELQELNKSLSVQQKEKEKLIEENRVARNQLQEEKRQQESLMATLKKDESKYAGQVKQKQNEAAAIDRQIEEMIKAAIAEANKKVEATGSKTTTKGSSTTFAMTAEAKELAKNFTSNKGKLPWPVERGVVVTRFGTTQHPTLPNVKTYSSGVEIATDQGAKARAAFDGEVIAILVIRGDNKAVQIRHGDYITVYQNIGEVYVRKGDKVKTKQEIGKVFTNPNTGKTILKFLIFQNTTKLNPTDWVYKM